MRRRVSFRKGCTKNGYRNAENGHRNVKKSHSEAKNCRREAKKVYGYTKSTKGPENNQKRIVKHALY